MKTEWFAGHRRSPKGERNSSTTTRNNAWRKGAIATVDEKVAGGPTMVGGGDEFAGGEPGGTSDLRRPEMVVKNEVGTGMVGDGPGDLDAPDKNVFCPPTLQGDL
jgi:hypothetical protein